MIRENGGNHRLPCHCQIGLVVGNFTHDVIFHDSFLLSRTLGGAVSFISNVFSSSLSSNSFDFVSKVGSDFNYSVPFDPIVSSSSKTTLFHAYFPSQNSDRVLRRIANCAPIFPTDLPQKSYQFGIAAAVAGEIPKETLARLFVQCETVLVDIQGLIRTFDEEDGNVKLKLLKNTEFYEMLDKVGFLKASSEEAEFMNVEEVRKKCCVIVTDGKDGCRVYWKDGCVKVPPFEAKQVDPTGAGDSFLGGFVVGLVSGLNLADSALLGNFFGSITVGQVGVPKFEQRMMQKVKQELERKTVNSCCGNDGVDFLRSEIDEELYSSLLEVAKLSRPLCSIPQDDEVGLVSHKKLIHLIEAAFSGNFTEAVTCTRDILSSGIEPNALMSQLSSFVVQLLSDTSFSASNTKKRMEWLCKTLQILTETEKELMKIDCNHSATVIAAILQIESASPSEGICHLQNKSDMVDTERKVIAQQFSNVSSTNERSNLTEISKINGEAWSKGQKYESIDSIAKATELKLRLLSLTSFPLTDASIETYSQDLLFEEANLSRRFLEKDFLGPGQHMHGKHYMNGELKRSQSCAANIGRRENVKEDPIRLSAKSHLMKWARPCRNSAVMNSISKSRRSYQKKSTPTSSSSSSKSSPSKSYQIRVMSTNSYWCQNMIKAHST